MYSFWGDKMGAIKTTIRVTSIVAAGLFLVGLFGSLGLNILPGSAFTIGGIAFLFFYVLSYKLLI